MQLRVPGEHDPAELPQVAPPPGLPSSTLPSQSSSSPLQTSGAGPLPPTQVSPPPMHIWVPLVHSPAELPHAAPPPGLPSSVAPSQSSSSPLQLSVPGPVPP